MLKRKLQKGRGTFPIDAPMNDATVTLHYSVHAEGEGGKEATLLDTRSGDPLEFSTGANTLAHTPPPRAHAVQYSTHLPSLPLTLNP